MNRIMINGKCFSGNSIIIQDGVVINGSKQYTKDMKDIEVKKSISTDSISSINIESKIADVEVVSSDKPKDIDAVLTGSVDSISNIELVLVNDDGRLNIAIKSEKNFSHRNLKLKVYIPKVEYESFTANLTYGDIKIFGDFYVSRSKIHCTSGDVLILKFNTKNLEVGTISGDVDIKSNFSVCNVSVKSGDVNVFLDAKKDFTLNINSISGDVNVELGNVKNLELCTKKVSGSFKNTYREHGKYTANINISVVSGDIRIK